jgi:hypothetical protein
VPLLGFGIVAVMQMMPRTTHCHRDVQIGIGAYAVANALTIFPD